MKEYSFVDMHIHSSYSDEELCDITIEQILTKAQERATEIGSDCVISIADHNSILGIIKAREILKNNPEKYSNVKLINGIEFTTDLIEMSQKFGDKRAFTRCHTLAYGYDENNKELIAYSKIAHKFFSINDNIGLQICAARRTICEHFNIYIPFSVYESMAELNINAHFKTRFVQITVEYLKANNIEVNESVVKNIIDNFIKDKVGYVREASAQGRLKLSEVSKLVNDANGELVIAHPSILRITHKGINQIAKINNISPKLIYSVTNNKYGNNTDFAHIRNRKLVLNSFIDAFEEVANCKISGIEKYYSVNVITGLDKDIEQICQERQIYETCGSDYHGEKMHPNKGVGDCLTTEIQQAYKNEFNYITSDYAPINISAISGAEHLLDERKNQCLNKAILKNTKGELIPAKHLELAVLKAKENKIKKVSPYVEGEINKIDFNKRINELVEVVGRLNTISEQVDSPKRQAKLLLRLNLFAENIVYALRDLKFKSNKYEYIRTLDNYEQVVTLLNEINKKFNGLIRENPELLDDLKYDMKHYYNKNHLAIANLANYKLMPISETEYQK